MIDDKIRAVLAKRKVLHPDDDYNTEKCWLKEIDILCNDMNETIDFLRNRCTDEEFSWISEVFDKVAERSQCADFIACLYEVAKKYPEETNESNILEFIDSAKELIE